MRQAVVCRDRGVELPFWTKFPNVSLIKRRARNPLLSETQHLPGIVDPRHAISRARKPATEFSRAAAQIKNPAATRRFIQKKEFQSTSCSPGGLRTEEVVVNRGKHVIRQFGSFDLRGVHLHE